MKKAVGHLNLFIRVILVWMFLFFMQRMVFLYWATDLRQQGINGVQIALANLKAIPMDVSSLSYSMLIPVVLLIIHIWTNRDWTERAFRIAIMLLFVITCLIVTADIGLFQQWGTRLDKKALSYLAFPEQAGAAMSGTPLFMLLALFIGMTIIGLYLFRKVIRPLTPANGIASKSTLTITLLALCLVGIRGGVQDIPIDKSWSYHSTIPALNQAATNGFWNFLEVISTPADIDLSEYELMKPDRAKFLVDQLHANTRNPSESWFTLEHPNILVVFMEGIPANVVGCMNGEEGVTPELDRVADEGIAFTNFYSTGFRTEQGLCAMLSGFPSQPTTTVIRKYGKFDKLPSLIRRLGQAGYSSSYFYGGDVEFANTRSYLSTMGMQYIGSESDFDENQPRTNWGVLDEALMDQYLRTGLSSRSPFFHIIMTSTSHEPYDKAPVPDVFNAKALPDYFRNTVHYTDSSIGKLMRGLKKWPGYDSTVVLILSDHGHQLPDWLHNHASERHRIPCILTGGALRNEYRGTIDSTYATHVDLPRTILKQLHLVPTGFPWSRDILAKDVSHFAFWTFNDGYGIADNEGELLYNHVTKDTISTTYPQELLNSRWEAGNAYLQELIRAYKELDS